MQDFKNAAAQRHPRATALALECAEIMDDPFMQLGSRALYYKLCGPSGPSAVRERRSLGGTLVPRPAEKDRPPFAQTFSSRISFRPT